MQPSKLKTVWNCRGLKMKSLQWCTCIGKLHPCFLKFPLDNCPVALLDLVFAKGHNTLNWAGGQFRQAMKCVFMWQWWQWNSPLRSFAALTFHTVIKSEKKNYVWLNSAKLQNSSPASAAVFAIHSEKSKNKTTKQLKNVFVMRRKCLRRTAGYQTLLIKC